MFGGGSKGAGKVVSLEEAGVVPDVSELARAQPCACRTACTRAMPVRAVITTFSGDAVPHAGARACSHELSGIPSHARVPGTVGTMCV